MKRLTTFLMALLLTWIGASAQSTDETENYIQNPSFENENVDNLTADGSRSGDEGGAWAVTELTGWTLTLGGTVDVCDLMSAKASATDNSLGVPTAAADGTYWLYLKKTWGDNAGSASVKQTVTLSAGTYMLTVQSMAVAGSATANLVAGDASKSIVINGTTSSTLFSNIEWTTNTLKFTVEEDETEVEIGVEVTFPTGASVGSFLIDNFQLYEVMELTAHEDKFEASSGAGTANAVPTADCEAEFGHWSTTGSTAIALNTWSTESDASQLTNPFCQVWVGSGTLGAATISHETIVGLPEGIYTISMDIRILNERGNAIGKGTTFHANGGVADVYEDLDDTDNDGNEGSSGSNPEVYGNYKLNCEVGSDGLLDISIVIPENVTYNWIAWKNLSVVMDAEKDNYPTVTALDGDMDADAKQAMEAAIAAYNADKSSETFHAAIDALQDAYVAIQKYGTLHECEAELDDWSISPTNSTTFQLNTWSTEADPSGMKQPFIEYWKGSGNPLTDAVISHETITGTAGAIYSVSIDYRAFNENSTKVVSQGSTFNANETSADLCVGTRAVFNDVSEEEYAIGYTMLCQADATTGAIDINFDIKDADFDWFAFKNLVVKTFDGEWPELTAATGDMHTGYAEAQTAALEAYASTPTFATYLEAFNAVNAAHLSALFYADVQETLEELDLDEAGLAKFDELTDGAWSSKTLEYQADMIDIFVESVLAQTTIGKDITYAMENSGTWSGNTGTYEGGRERYQTANYTDETTTSETSNDAGKILYYTLEGLQSGATYQVTFYAAANSTSGREFDNIAGDGIAQVFANSMVKDVTVKDQTGCTLSDYPHTLACTVGEDGVLEFGLQNIGTGGNWYVVEGVSLTYYGVVVNDNDYAEGEEVTVDGTVYEVVGDNLFVNGGFNNSVCGWTAGNGYTDVLSAANVTITEEGGYNDGAYITLPTSVGAANAGTPTQAIKVTPGKSYLFVGYTSGTAPSDANKRYSALFEMENATTEANHTEGGTETYGNTIVQLEWGNGEDEYNGWTRTIGAFTVPATSEEGTYSYVGMRMNWSTGSYDGFQLYEVEATGVEWEMTEAGWGTMILPFEAEIPTGLTAYAGDALALDEEESTITVGDAADAIKANTPYLVSGTAGDYTFTGTPVEAESLTLGMLTGTLVDLTQDNFTADGTEYVLQKHEATDEDEGGLAFYPITSASEGVTLDAYHCYLTISSDVSPTALHLPGMSTGIVAVEGAETLANDAIYDLSGRRVSKAVKGVYIQNGKKVLVK